MNEQYFFFPHNIGKWVEKLSLTIAVTTAMDRHLILPTYSSCYLDFISNNSLSNISPNPKKYEICIYNT